MLPGVRDLKLNNRPIDQPRIFQGGQDLGCCVDQDGRLYELCADNTQLY
jgi:hypothetical protein